MCIPGPVSAPSVREEAVRAEPVEALRRRFEYEGTSPTPRRYQSTKIDLRKFNLKGKGEVISDGTRLSVPRVGVDLSKKVYHVHAVDRSGRKMLSKAMSPQAFYAWCVQLPSGCMVATEACGGVHHVARRLSTMGLDARMPGFLDSWMIAGDFVAPYRMAGKRGKNDTNDAAAICETATLMGIGPVTASAVMTAAKRDDRISRWLLQLKERVSEDAHTGPATGELGEPAAPRARASNGVLSSGSYLGPRRQASTPARL